MNGEVFSVQRIIKKEIQAYIVLFMCNIEVQVSIITKTFYNNITFHCTQMKNAAIGL